MCVAIAVSQTYNSIRSITIGFLRTDLLKGTAVPTDFMLWIFNVIWGQFLKSDLSQRVTLKLDCVTQGWLGFNHLSGTRRKLSPNFMLHLSTPFTPHSACKITRFFGHQKFGFDPRAWWRKVDRAEFPVYFFLGLLAQQWSAQMVFGQERIEMPRS